MHHVLWFHQPDHQKNSLNLDLKIYWLLTTTGSYTHIVTLILDGQDLCLTLLVAASFTAENIARSSCQSLFSLSHPWYKMDGGNSWFYGRGRRRHDRTDMGTI